MVQNTETIRSASSELDKKRKNYLYSGALKCFTGSTILSQVILISGSDLELGGTGSITAIATGAFAALALANSAADFSNAAHQSRLVASHESEILRLQNDNSPKD